MEYVIRIVNNTKDEEGIKPVSGNSDSESVGGEQSESSSTSYATRQLKKLVSAGAIKHTVDQVVSHQLSQISLETGTREVQQRATFAYQTVGGLVTSVAAGAVAGGVPGALVAGVVYGVHFAVSSVLKQDTINKERELEDISRRMKLMRATTSGRRFSNITEF